MKKLLALGNQYIRESDWRIIAVLKFCLLALGTIIGSLIPEKYKKPTIIASLVVFVVSYIPLMAKLVKLAMRKDEGGECGEELA